MAISPSRYRQLSFKRTSTYPNLVIGMVDRQIQSFNIDNIVGINISCFLAIPPAIMCGVLCTLRCIYLLNSHYRLWSNFRLKFITLGYICKNLTKKLAAHILSQFIVYTRRNVAHKPDELISVGKLSKGCHVTHT